MPQQLGLPDYNVWKEFNWESSRSIEDLKKYIRTCVRFKDFKLPEQKEVDTLKHDLEIRKNYEQVADKVQNKLKELLENWGAEAVIPGRISIHGEILMLSQAVEQNLAKLKPTIENWLSQELTVERETTQQALQTSQEWHERQKAEIISQKEQIIEQWKGKYNQFLTQRKSTLTQEIQLIKEALHD